MEVSFMNKNSNYEKLVPQQVLEKLAYNILKYNLSVEEMEDINSKSKKIISSNKQNASTLSIEALSKEEIQEVSIVFANYGLSLEAGFEALKLLADFKQILANCLICISHEKRVLSSIRGLAEIIPSIKTGLRQDTINEVVSIAYLGLFNELSKGPDKGRLRIDSLLDTPSSLYYNIRYYMKNNVIIDTARAYNVEYKHIEPIYTTTKDGDELLKPDNPDRNRSILLNDLESSLVSQCHTFSRYDIVTAILDRFLVRKPVAAYLYLKAVLLDDYNTITECENLCTQDFNQLFYNTLESIEKEYSMTLDIYKNYEANSIKYIDSFKTIEIQKQRDRLDKLLSTARKDVFQLEAIEELAKTEKLLLYKV